MYQRNFKEDFYIMPINNSKPAKGMRLVLSANGYGIEKEYFAMIATGSKGGAIADFSNTMSASQGVFLANANNT